MWLCQRKLLGNVNPLISKLQALAAIFHELQRSRNLAVALGCTSA